MNRYHVSQNPEVEAKILAELADLGVVATADKINITADKVSQMKYLAAVLQVRKM